MGQRPADGRIHEKRAERLRVYVLGPGNLLRPFSVPSRRAKSFLAIDKGKRNGKRNTQSAVNPLKLLILSDLWYFSQSQPKVAKHLFFDLVASNGSALKTLVLQWFPLRCVSLRVVAFRPVKEKQKGKHKFKGKTFRYFTPQESPSRRVR